MLTCSQMETKQTRESDTLVWKLHESRALLKFHNPILFKV